MPSGADSCIVRARWLAQQAIQSPQPLFDSPVPRPDSFIGTRPASPEEGLQHGARVAEILKTWGTGPELQAAGLLHSLVWANTLSPAQVAEACGPRTAFLVEEYRRILLQEPDPAGRYNRYTARRIKLYLAAYRDPELAILGLANLWEHFVHTDPAKTPAAHHLTEVAQNVLRPLLMMMGMWHLKEEVEDWVMRHGSSRGDYLKIRQRLDDTEPARQKAFELVRQTLKDHLPAGARLERKKRTPAQLYNPQGPEKIYPDLLQQVTIDILVDTEAECYHALHQIHRFWKPIEGKVRDFTSFSRLNGYRCLQTEVILPFETGHIRAHFHIRTHEMEKINRWGAAKWPEIQSVPLPHAWWSRREELYPCLAGAAMGSLPEKLYVFSPLGEIFSFHRGDTVVDYAYMVHSEVAHQTSRFRVNGEPVPATYRLRHLDLVELEQDPQASGPTRLWLTAAQSSRARVHIQNFLKQRSQNSLQGQTLFDRHLQKLKDHYRIDIPDHRLKFALRQAARKYGLNSTDDLLAEIAAGRQSSDPILHPIFSNEIVRQVQLPPDIHLTPNQMKLAQCCRPRPGESIVGRPRYRQDRLVELKIHQADCPHLAGRDDTIPLSWRLRPRMNVIQRLEVEALDEQWLLQNILAAVYHYLPSVTVHKADYQALRGVARLSLTIEARDMDLIEQIADDIRHLPHHRVNNVRVMHLLVSEQEELAQPATTFNPYRRLPVRQREMFFGRAEELEKIYELLQQDTGVIFIRGQKRVGKTSLLYHLRNHHLPQGPFMPAFVDLQILNVMSGPDFFYQIASSVFDDLQKDNRLHTVGPPLRELFTDKPALELVRYLQNIQHQFAPHRLVVLIDEFSRAIDAYRRHRLDRDFFPQWRSILQAVAPAVSMVMVIQQQAFDSLQEQNPRLPAADPVWPLLEMGETIILKPLDEQSARNLIERPTYNYLDYSPNALRYVWRLTGGSPFLIHAFCHDLVNYMARTGRRRVRQSDVDAVQEEFMSPVNESLFQHLLDVVKGPAWPVCQRLTQFLDETDTPVPLAEIRAALPHLSDTRLLAMMDDLEDQHIVTRIEPDCWQFTSLLFGRWLARNTMLEQLKAAPPTRRP